MSKNELMKMNLQYFADQEESQEEKQTETEKTVTVGEMKRRLGELEERFKSEREGLKKSYEDALEEYKAEQELNGQELQKFREKKAEEDKQALLDEIEDLKNQANKRALQDEAIKVLGERKLPVTDKVLAFVVKDTADDTLEAISAMESIIKEVKKDFVNQGSPLVSGGLGSEPVSNKDVFAGAKITNY